MTITYTDTVSSINTYLKNKQIEKDLVVDLSSELKIPSALSSVQMLDEPDNLQLKSSFVYSMLQNVGVTIKCKDQVLCTFVVNEGMRLEDVDTFAKHPAIYRYFLDSIFSVFLKNSYPLLSESQEAEKD